jgi:hypothetical protein
LLLAYACSKNIKVYQMDVKSSFLNGELEEEVYIEQPEGFQLSENADYVCKLKKALYGLKQAPRAWYSRLDKYLQQEGFRKGSADNNLYIKVSQGNILLIEVYVDDIIFGSDDDRLSQKFAKDMQNEFEMSLLGELSFFLGLQIRQRNQGIFISQTKYIREMLKRFGMEDCKPVITPMQTNCKLSKDDDSKSTDQRQYRSMIGKPTICDNIQTRCNAGSWTGGTISSSTKGITCISSEENFQISQRNIRVWIMVSKRKGSISYFLHRCRLGRLY